MERVTIACTVYCCESYVQKLHLLLCLKMHSESVFFCAFCYERLTEMLPLQVLESGTPYVPCVVLWHGSPCLHLFRTVVQNMGSAPRVQSTLKKIMKMANGRNWKVTRIVLDFLMLTNQSQPLIIKRQVLTDLAASMVHVIRRRKKRKGRKCCCYQCDQLTKMC